MNKYLSSTALVSLLRQATEEERRALTRVANPEDARLLAAEKLQQVICGAGGSSLGNWVRSGGVGYLEIVSDVVGLLKIPGLPKYYALDTMKQYSLDRMDTVSLVHQHGLDAGRCVQEVFAFIDKAEGAILAKLVTDAYANMEPEERAKFDKVVSDIAAKFGHPSSVRGLTGAAGAMALAQVGGFATYTLMSSVLSIVSFGAFSFPMYTAASSLLSVVIGPVGWVALGGAFAYKLGKPKDHMIIMLVLYIAMIRQRLAHEASQAAKPKTVRALHV